MPPKYTDGNREFEAELWNQNGDHSLDFPTWLTDSETGESFKSEGKLVRYFRHPNYNGLNTCSKCGQQLDKHGWLDKEDIRVCPGSIVLTLLPKREEHEVLSEEEFYKTFKRVDNGKRS